METSRKLMWHDKWVAHMKEEARQSREADLPTISHKTWQAENPDVLLGHIQQMSGCHCSFPSDLPTNCGAPFGTLPESLTSFTVHLPAHPCAFHIHFLSAHNTGTVFLNFFLSITSSSVFLTMEPFQEPSFLSQMMMGSSSSLPLFIVPHTAPPTPPKSKRDWEDDSTAFLDGFV
jgi:hypothetical protein